MGDVSIYGALPIQSRTVEKSDKHVITDEVSFILQTNNVKMMSFGTRLIKRVDRPCVSFSEIMQNKSCVEIFGAYRAFRQ